MLNISMLENQHVVEIKKCLCVPYTQFQTISFVSAWIDLAGGINLAIHGLLNSPLKRRVEWMERSNIFVIL